MTKFETDTSTFELVNLSGINKEYWIFETSHKSGKRYAIDRFNNEAEANDNFNRLCRALTQECKA